MKEITIVSAFFNINRQEWGKFSRTSEQYLEYFELWARMNNKLIVYVETEELAKKIIEIRRKFGLEKKTIVNIVTNYIEIDNELYESIKKATINNIQQEFRLMPNNPESINYNYNYIMLLKMWCVQDAISKGQAEGMVAWVDFGYNHGGEIIDNSSNFNFTWEYDFENKINLFAVKELDDRPIFDIVRSMDVYIMGTIIVGSHELWRQFWLLMRKAMISLNDCGLVDDDQTVLLMAYRMNPKIFKIYQSGWMLPIKQFGGEHLKLVNNKRDNKGIKEFIKKPLKQVKESKINFVYSTRVYKNLQKINRS